MIKLSFVIPVYKSTESLKKISKEIAETFANNGQYSYEIIFVNDSPFNILTTSTLDELAGKNKNIIAIHLTKNYGQHPSTLCGMAEADGDYIVTLDDDLQHKPSDIFKLLKKKEHDIVCALFPKKTHSIFTRFTSYIKGHFDYWIIGKPKGIQLSSFRLIKCSIVKNMLLFKGPNLFLPALMFSITNDVVNVDCKHAKREHGASGYHFLGLHLN